jgi:hypothetical protein
MASSIGGILSFVLVWNFYCYLRCHTLTCIEDLIDVNVYHVMVVSFLKI